MMANTCFCCKGTGYSIDFCRSCRGDRVKDYATGEICSECDGTGHEENKCTICWGTGESEVFSEEFICR